MADDLEFERGSRAISRSQFCRDTRLDLRINVVRKDSKITFMNLAESDFRGCNDGCK